MAVLTKSTASAAFAESDARDAVRSIIAAEGLPSPVDIRLTSDGKGVMVRVADRDQVDEWAEMLTAVAVRLGDYYGVGWQQRVPCPGLPLALYVNCAVAPIKWQPRQIARVSA